MKRQSRRSGKPEDRREPAAWKYTSPEEPGFHAVVTPDNSPCRSVRMSRLNLRAGDYRFLRDEALEMVAGVVAGEVELRMGGAAERLGKFDGFYLPARKAAEVHAATDCILYIGAAACEGVGECHVRRYEPGLPVGPVRQVHGRPPYERDVFMVLGPDVPASRLIAGWTWSKPGAWTSWPPHQHERDLEEVYAYFDMPRPHFGLHLSYRKSGAPEAVHVVSSGDFVIAPSGYHPTVAIPGVRNSYFWVLAAHSRTSRRYDLAVADPLMPV
jgi:5-deoxy-glucuronate isomerase